MSARDNKRRALRKHGEAAIEKSCHFDRSGGGPAGGAKWRNLLLFPGGEGGAEPNVFTLQTAFARAKKSKRFLHFAPPAGPPPLRSK